MYYIWLTLIIVAVIALVLFVAIWLITRAVQFMKLEEDIREQWEKDHEFYEYESRPVYKK